MMNAQERLLDYNRQLRERVEELEETIRQMKTSSDPEPLPADVPYLSRTEERVFRSLRRRGGYVTHETILAAMYDGEDDGDNQSLRHFISRLRKRLEPSPYRVKTVWGRGYKLVACERRNRSKGAKQLPEWRAAQ